MKPTSRQNDGALAQPDSRISDCRISVPALASAFPQTGPMRRAIDRAQPWGIDMSANVSVERRWGRSFRAVYTALLASGGVIIGYRDTGHRGPTVVIFHGLAGSGAGVPRGQPSSRSRSVRKARSASLLLSPIAA